MARSLTGLVLNGRYRLEERLGAGGMGAVYRAQDLATGQAVAVKVLLDLLEGEEHRHRFQREFRILTRLSHPRIVAVYDYGQWDGTPYYVMELLAGVDLAAYRRSRDGRLPEGEILPLAVQLCQGLAYIHTQGLIHRDLKPGNVMLIDRSVKLMDFGLARWRDVSAPLTTSGALLGTVNYMAPEQAQGQPLDSRADLYALGVILYELATGRLPFSGDSPVAVLLGHIQAVPTRADILQPDLSPAFVELVMDLLAKRPADRPATAEDILAALQRIGERPADVTRPAMLAQSHADVVFRAHLVGREAELSRLTALLDRAWQPQAVTSPLSAAPLPTAPLPTVPLPTAGTSGTSGTSDPARLARLALVEGEAGVGKSRLVRELADQVRLRGGKVLTGICFEGERLPYGPFVEAVRAFLGTGTEGGSAADDTLLDGLRAELKPLLPGLDSDTFLPPLDPEQARLRLFNAMAQLLIRLSERHPLLLLLDDLHWADDASLELLGYLVRNSQGHPIFICGTARREEHDEHHPLTRLVWALSRQRLVERVELAPLSPKDTGDLLAALLGLSQPPEMLARPIFQYAEGNPFFVEELVKMLAEEGRLQRHDGQWRLGGDVTVVSLEALSPPATIRELVERRLSAVPTAEREVLERAAVLGREFSFDLLLDLDDMTEEALLDAVTDLLRTRLIDEVRVPQEDRYRFSHGVVQEVVYAGLPGRRRRRLHRLAGEVLERHAIHAGQLSLVAGPLARHFAEGGDPGRAATYGLQAGDRARQVYANQEAIYAYQLALNALSSLPDAERTACRAQELALDAGLGEVYLLIGEYEQAAVCFQGRLALIQADPADPEEMAAAWQSLAASHRYRGQYAEATLSLEWGLGALGPGAAHPQKRAGLLLDLGWIAVRQGRYDEAIERGQQALQLAKAADDDGARAGAYDCLGMVHRYQSDYPAAIDYYQRSLALKEAAGDKAGISRTLNNLGIIYDEQDDFPAAEGCYRQSLSLCDEMGHRLGQAMLHNNLGVIHFRRQEYEQAIASYEQTLTLCQQIGHLSGIVMAHDNLGRVFEKVGALDRAVDHLRQAESLAADLGEQEALLDTYGVLAEVHLSLHEVAAADEYARRALELARTLGMHMAEEEARERLARLLIVQGQVGAAEEQLRAALELSQSAGHRDLSEKIKGLLAQIADGR
jgi:tetratricopeptide (TPR) repeat protein